MNKILIGFLGILLTCFQASAQTKIICGNELLMKQMETSYPGYKARVDASFSQAKNYAGRATSGVFYLPVVVHVVWKTNNENLDDSLIYQQINVLNRDYGRTNADTVNCRAIFDSVGANTGIQFVLKQIIRVNTLQNFQIGLGGMPDDIIKTTTSGGSDAVDVDHNLNIWIVNIQPSLLGQVLGYSYPPANLSNWPAGQNAPSPGYDGVVLDYHTVGSNNPFPMNFGGQNIVIKGRTCVHEVGHYLGLRHIWGDGGSFTGTNDCLQSDGIDDTPFANSQSNFDCNKFQNTCPKIETYYHLNTPDMVENYMDYSAETCMNLFTKGQASLMQNVLLTERSLLPSNNVGINSVETESFSLEPNPSNSFVRIKGLNQSSNLVVSVLNQVGEKLNIFFDANKSTLDVSALSTGIYFVEIKTPNAIWVKKLVKI